MMTTTTSTTTTNFIPRNLSQADYWNTEKCGIKLFVFYLMMLLASWITQWQHEVIKVLPKHLTVGTECCN